MIEAIVILSGCLLVAIIAGIDLWMLKNRHKSMAESARNYANQMERRLGDERHFHDTTSRLKVKYQKEVEDLILREQELLKEQAELQAQLKHEKHKFSLVEKAVNLAKKCRTEG